MRKYISIEQYFALFLFIMFLAAFVGAGIFGPIIAAFVILMLALSQLFNFLACKLDYRHWLLIALFLGDLFIVGVGIYYVQEIFK